MELKSIEQWLGGNPYPGRGVLLGIAPGGEAVAAYFIMGRSANSRNRIFVETPEGGLKTQAYDPSKLEDPSLIIYAPVRKYKGRTIVTNGDQTDTILSALQHKGSFQKALATRAYEPDAPNYTPRISGLLTCREGKIRYSLAVLKRGEGSEGCLRYFYEYASPARGEGRLVHTYETDGAPLPSFQGEPRRVALEDDVDAFTRRLWDALDAQNRVSLFVRYIAPDGAERTRIVNANG